MPAGQRLTFRVYFGTVTTGFATLKNVVAKGQALVVSSTRRSRAGALQLYPNPATAQCLLMHPPAGSDSRIAVYSVLGRRVATVVWAAGTQQTTLDLKDLAASLDLVRYASGTGQLSLLLHKE